MAPIINTAHPHLDIEQWLIALELENYRENLKKFNGVEELMYFCEADIKQLGVKNSAHRARIVSSLVALRDKWQKGEFVIFLIILFHFFLIISFVLSCH